MKTKLTLIATCLILAAPTALRAQRWDAPASKNNTPPASSDKIVTDEPGYVVCTGGGSEKPLFSGSCNQFTATRIGQSGSTKYEAKCIDSNNKTFFLACDALMFEYAKLYQGRKQPQRYDR